MYAVRKVLHTKLDITEQFQHQVTTHNGRPIRLLVEQIEVELGVEDPMVTLVGYLLRGREVLGPHREPAKLENLPEGIIRSLAKLI